MAYLEMTLGTSAHVELLFHETNLHGHKIFSNFPSNIQKKSKRKSKPQITPITQFLKPIHSLDLVAKCLITNGNLIRPLNPSWTPENNFIAVIRPGMLNDSLLITAL